ncbi:MAG: 2-succinyl-5-enolpyruvyl-6-hydroxy-3-cyclohexene-1-carboxylic-acid synthase [Myxococcota bacterium]
MGTPADLQSEWARLVIGSLARAGVRHVVASPGSRSTPYLIAALENETLDVISAIDERSAAHFALGQARVSARPSLLLCTSGSAPANYYPAVVEAYEAGVPLLVLSADRPPELHGRGANQTTNQKGMFGTHVLHFANLGEPSADGLRSLRDALDRAYQTSVGPRPGPVHLNAQARKPLEPKPASGAEAEKTHASVDGLLLDPPSGASPRCEVNARAVDDVLSALAEASRPVILCGPGPASQGSAVAAIESLSTASGAKVLAEAASQFRFASCAARVSGGFDALWSTATGRDALTPDFVLQLGASPVSKGWSRIASHPEVRRFVVHPFSPADPSATAERVIASDVATFLEALSEKANPQTRALDYTSRFSEAEAIVWKEVADVLSAADDELTEAAVAPVLVDTLPEGAALVVGNSLPVRDLDRWAPPRETTILVFAQRGVSGIDGLVSSASGVASLRTAPTVLLVGDVSFLHDINGLELAVRSKSPLVIVVLNNGGGRIFEQLPIADRGRGDWLPFFTTPRPVDLSGAAALHGCDFMRVNTVSGLDDAVRAGLAASGCTVVEARVPASSAKEQGQALLTRLELALRSWVS